MLAVCLCLFAAGCVNLEPQESTIRFYVLGESAERSAPSGEALDSGLTVGLRRTRLAAYLDTPHIIIRLGAHEVRFSEGHRWGEDLRRGISRTISKYLKEEDVIRQVDMVPWPAYVEHDYILQLQVLQFEADAEDLPAGADPGDVDELALQAHVLVEWQLIDPETNDVLHAGRSAKRVGLYEGGDYGGVVSGLDAALRQLAGEIARVIDEIHAGR